MTVQAITPPAVREARLQLSDGRQVVSRVVRVPARLGGRPKDAGLYFQVVRGPSPIPVSLHELDAHDMVLRTIKLHRIVECTRHPLKYLRGGIRTIVRGKVPDGGPRFSIVGERYRFLGHIYFVMKIETGQGGGGESENGERPHLFSWERSTGCKPHEYAILYGILTAPRDRVLARTSSGRLFTLRHARVPASLHVHGVLAYAVLPAMASELIVRSPSGGTVFTEKLRQLATEAAETCQGESEGTS